MDLIYKELEWELLAERRNRRGLQMLYYNQNNNAVSYLCDLIPQKKDQSTTVYSLRNGSDIINIMYNSVILLLPLISIHSIDYL